MKVLLINGSPHPDGNTSIALEEVARTLHEEGVETETLWIGTRPVQGCIGCYKCQTTGVCVFTDELYVHAREAVSQADAIIIGSPVYYAGPSGSLCALLDRLFYSSGKLLMYKPAASVVCCRRGGASATFDRLNKYYTILSMPVVSSQYWNSVHGREKGEARYDAEGLQTMRTLGKNMVWVLKSIHNPSSPEHPAPEARQATNFIRNDHE